jgi:hypothetical protein
MMARPTVGRPPTLEKCDGKVCQKCGQRRLRVMQTRLARGIRIRYLYCFGCGARFRQDEFVLLNTQLAS